MNYKRKPKNEIDPFKVSWLGKKNEKNKETLDIQYQAFNCVVLS